MRKKINRAFDVYGGSVDVNVLRRRLKCTAEIFYDNINPMIESGEVEMYSYIHPETRKQKYGVKRIKPIISADDIAQPSIEVQTQKRYIVKPWVALFEE